MHRTRNRRDRPHRRSEPRNGSDSKIVAAGIVGVFAMLAVVALPVVVPSQTAQPRAKPPGNPWDSPGAASKAGLENIARAGQAASATRLQSDPVSHVRDVSAKYTTTRLAEIRDDVAKIDANPWRTALDLQRRQALLDEQKRLLRY